VDINQIISKLYLSKDIDDCICKMIDIRYREDFKQELFLILLAKPDQVIDAEANGKLKYYVVRIIINLSRQSRNIYFKKYLDNKTIYGDISDRPDEMICDSIEKEEKILKEIGNMDEDLGTFYYRELVKLVAQEGSISKAGRKVGIPKSSISKAIKRVREHLNKKVK